MQAAWRLLEEYRDRFVITNQRLIRVNGVFDTQRASVPLGRILDITVKKPWVGHMLNYGHFVFESAAQVQGLNEIRYVASIDEREDALRIIMNPERVPGGGRRRDRRRHMSLERTRLPFDPVEEAARQWATQWDEMPRMRAVTSLMRVHQLVLTELDELLRPLGLTFARYEVLVLLSFSRRGALPLGKIGERLQVHATSVTPLVKRLEAADLIRRTPHPEDGRAVLASITENGRAVMDRATKAIVGARFALGSLSEVECDRLTNLLTRPRAAAGDF